MPLNPPDIAELKAIIDWVDLTEDIRELTLKYGDVELHISRNSGGPAAAPTVPAAAPTVPAAALPAPAAPAPAPAPAPADTPVSAGGVDEDVAVTAPMVGIYYSAPKPGAADFVEEGAHVDRGAVLCIVEVMKLMNNVEAPVSGTVTKVLVENNDAVAFGQRIMTIRPDA